MQWENEGKGDRTGRKDENKTGAFHFVKCSLAPESFLGIL